MVILGRWVHLSVSAHPPSGSGNPWTFRQSIGRGRSGRRNPRGCSSGGSRRWIPPSIRGNPPAGTLRSITHRIPSPVVACRDRPAIDANPAIAGLGYLGRSYFAVHMFSEILSDVASSVGIFINNRAGRSRERLHNAHFTATSSGLQGYEAMACQTVTPFSGGLVPRLGQIASSPASNPQKDDGSLPATICRCPCGSWGKD